MGALTSKLLDLRNRLAGGVVPLSKALVQLQEITAALPADDLKEWLDFEIHGYLDEQSVPQYRVVSGRVCVWRGATGWRHIALDEPELEEALTNRALPQPLSGIENMLPAGSQEDVPIAFHPEVEAFLCDCLPGNPRICLLVSAASFHNLHQTVQDVTVKWMAKLAAQHATPREPPPDLPPPSKADDEYIQTRTQAISRDLRQKLNVHQILARSAGLKSNED